MSTIVSEPQSTHTANYRLDVEAFSLFGDSPERGNHVHYEADYDLPIHCKAAVGSGTSAGVVLVELGIDGYETHRARLALQGFTDDAEAYTYDGDRVAALSDAIEALTAIRDQLEAMRAPTELRAVERNAFDIGRDVGRLETEGVRKTH